MTKMNEEIKKAILKRIKSYKGDAWRSYFNPKMREEVFGPDAPKITRRQLNFIINDLMYTLECDK